MRPILLAALSVNQTLPSGPAAIPNATALVAGSGSVNSVTTPVGVMRPSLLVSDSVNHRLPSGPRAMLSGALFAVGIGNSAMAPAPARAGAGRAAGRSQASRPA